MPVNLSKFLGKTVRVTFRDGSQTERQVEKNTASSYGETHPYFLDRQGSYTKEGCWYDKDDPSPADITEIEELEMSKYGGLEDRVVEMQGKIAEMQAEIDRLKAQERKVRTFREDIQRVLLSFHATPYDYKEFPTDYTERICGIVRNYLPPPIENPNIYYDTGYNDALATVRRNLGLDK